MAQLATVLWPASVERPILDAGTLSAIFELLPDPALVVRADGGARRIAMANAAARDVFRVEGEPMLASVIRRPEVLDLVEGSLTNGLSGQASWDSPSAQDRHLHAISRPLPPAPDGSALALLVVRDETDAKRNERMRADFLANASHELKTPLASLTGFIETLRGHAKDDPVARDRFLGVMADQADRMGRLITDLMSLSRIELNEHIPPSGEVDLAACARDVADSLSPIATPRGVTIEISGAASATMAGDRHQVLQVVQNLIENAVKYSGKGKTVRVEVTSGVTDIEASMPRNIDAASRSLLSPDPSPGMRFVALRVADEGVGIAREHVPRLTERFYRAPGQTSSTPGTGLGLAIVKHIVNRHRGGLFVETAAGKGSAFTAYFPQG